MKPSNLPSTCRGLVYGAIGQPLTVEPLAMPDAVPGGIIIIMLRAADRSPSVCLVTYGSAGSHLAGVYEPTNDNRNEAISQHIKVLAATVDSTMPEVLKGNVAGLTFPTPFIPGGRCVGRVVATGSDTTSLQLGQLVVAEPFIRGRDDSDVQVLWGLSQGASPMLKKLMEDCWRDGLYKEYARAPLENCYAVNEKVLLGSSMEGGFGYSIAGLTYISKQLVAYSRLRGIDLQAGETVIIAPAIGCFSSAAVEVASAMGTRVIAIGQSMTTPRKVAEHHPRGSPVQLTGNVEKDIATLQQFGKIDAYLDISPAAASTSTHVRSCLMALKLYGRASLME